MPARFIPYPQGLALVLRGERMQEALELTLEPAKELAEMISPVVTGQYRFGRILISQTSHMRISADGAKTRRRRKFVALPPDKRGGFVIIKGVKNGKAYAMLINKAPYAVYLEFGTRHMRRQRILGRSLAALRAT
jgi:hypothetical protein